MLGAIQKKMFVWHTGFWGAHGTDGWHYDLLFVAINLGSRPRAAATSSSGGPRAGIRPYPQRPAGVVGAQRANGALRRATRSHFRGLPT
jgi:hypothetical protein